MKKDILSMLPEELESELEQMGEPRFRARQIFSWLHRGARDFEEMTNLPKSLREKCKSAFRLYRPKVLKKQVSRLDGTVKYLWELWDGNAVETDVMQYRRPGALPGALRDPGRGFVLSAGFRHAHLQHRSHGHWRASGQL